MGDPAEELCLRLKEETLERIREDRKRASVRVAKMLGVIEKRLLDPDLDVNTLLRDSDQRDPNVTTHFSSELGLSPWAYISERRMELAGRMLVGSDFQVWRVGGQVGYFNPGSFNRAFKKWCGKSPGAFRQAARSGAAEPTPSPDELLSLDELRRAVAGDLPADRAEALADRLHELGDEICADYQPSLVQDGTVAVESAMARSLWTYIEPLSFELQMGAIESQGPHYRTRVLFYRLCTVSIEAEDDLRGFKLATLAMAALHAMGDRIGEGYLHAFARAWALTGHGYRRIGKLDKAAEDFDKAARMLVMAGDDVPPVIVAELCFYKAMLEIELGNFEEAEKLSKDGGTILQLETDRARELLGDALDWEEIEGGPKKGPDG